MLERLGGAASFLAGVAGLALLGYSGSVLFDAHAFQGQLARNLEALGEPRVRHTILEVAQATRHEAATSGLIGRLEIPRLELDAMITEGITGQALRRGIGHVPDTAFPGERGNVALAAHRDTYFRKLKDVEKGDHLRLHTPDGTFTYEVEQTLIVDPDRTDLIADTDEAALTLVTCYPFYWIGHAPKRFVVRCRPVGAAAASSAALEPRAANGG